MKDTEIRKLWIKDKQAEPNLSLQEFYTRYNLPVSSCSNACLSRAWVASQANGMKDFVRRIKRKAK